jgi:molybdopterin-synthase adenylyltransferase
MTANTQSREVLLRAIERSSLLSRSRRVRLNSTIEVLVGRIDIEGREVEIAVDIDPLRNHRLPVFTLRPWDALGFIPHIDPKGTICYLEHEGIIFDRHRPFEVVRECFDHVKRTLRDGVTGANLGDFVDEFEVYWLRLNPLALALSNLKLTDRVAEVLMGSSSSTPTALRLSGDAPALRHMPGASTDHGPWTAARAIYLPLEAGTTVIPPRSDQPFWDIDDVRRLLAYSSQENRERLAHLVSGQPREQEYLVVRLLRPSGGAALFGIRFEGIQGRHPLMEGGGATKLTPIAIFRRDKQYLVQRGGGHIAIADKRVLLIGCGAVGGQLAFELSRAGVEQLTLVDYDIHELHNTYRHVLGKHYWGERKATALRKEILQQLPFSQPKAVVAAIEEALADGRIELDAYDLVVSAIGNPTSELALNELVHRADKGPPIIFTWVDPYGIGGHAILTGMHNGTGCFECLYSAPDGSGELDNRAAFAAPRQKFRRSLAGCDALHTPYGSLDAARTAQLAARLAIDVLVGAEQHNRLCSWKGNASAFIDAGFELAPRYHSTLHELAQQEHSFASPTCRICSELGSDSSS